MLTIIAELTEDAATSSTVGSEAKNLSEKLAMDGVKANPGREIMQGKIGVPCYP